MTFSTATGATGASTGVVTGCAIGAGCSFGMNDIGVGPLDALSPPHAPAEITRANRIELRDFIGTFLSIPINSIACASAASEARRALVRRCGCGDTPIRRRAHAG